MDKVAALEQQFETIQAEIKTLEEARRDLSTKINVLNKRCETIKNKVCQIKSKESSANDWSTETYPWSAAIKKILQNTFHFKDFQFQQLSAINAVLSGKDVVVIMPTGAGKSLIYQLPSVYWKGITLVISPLISLITDQLRSLSENNIKAITLNSSNSKKMTNTVSQALTRGVGDFKLIYMTPEYLTKSKRIMNSLQKCYERKGLDCIAIDEVHCASMWGNDFRPDYRNLHILKTIFPKTPIIGVTATATEKVITECTELLDISGCLVLRAPYNRKNLFYEVVQKMSEPSVLQYLVDKIRLEYKNKSGIIYTHSINDSIELATKLQQKGVKVGAYHSQMTPELKETVYKKWLTNEYQVICATVAFGMGIDKPDVKFVIHHSISKSMENYYQESGRAGRNGKKANCILLYSMKDVFRVSALVATSTQNGLKHLYEIVKYCLESTKCRRSLISVHFDEEWDQSHCERKCDNCVGDFKMIKFNIIIFYRQLVSLIEHRKSVYETNSTPLSLLNSWFQTATGKQYRLSNIPIPTFSRELGERILMYLILSDYLKETLHFTLYTTISYIVKGPRTTKGELYMPMRQCDVPLSFAHLIDATDLPDIVIADKFTPTDSEELNSSTNSVALEESSKSDTSNSTSSSITNKKAIHEHSYKQQISNKQKTVSGPSVSSSDNEEEGGDIPINVIKSLIKQKQCSTMSDREEQSIKKRKYSTSSTEDESEHILTQNSVKYLSDHTRNQDDCSRPSMRRETSSNDSGHRSVQYKSKKNPFKDEGGDMPINVIKSLIKQKQCSSMSGRKEQCINKRKYSTSFTEDESEHILTQNSVKYSSDHVRNQDDCSRPSTSRETSSNDSGHRSVQYKSK